MTEFTNSLRVEICLQSGKILPKAFQQYVLGWRVVDFKQRIITLRDTKNRTSHTVPMILDVVKAMEELRKLSLERKDRAIDRPNSSPDDVVFGIGDNKKWWEAALKEAKKLRIFVGTTFATPFALVLPKRASSIKVIQEAAGHKTIAMSARYAHMDHTTLHNAMAVLNRPV